MPGEMQLVVNPSHGSSRVLFSASLSKCKPEIRLSVVQVLERKYGRMKGQEWIRGPGLIDPMW